MPTSPRPPAGPVTVTARLRPAETARSEEPAPPGQAWSADPQTLISPDQVARYNAYGELEQSDPPADDGLAAMPDPGHRGLNNFVYSIQWLLFAAVGAFGWWRLVSLEARRAEGRRHRSRGP